MPVEEHVTGSRPLGIFSWAGRHPGKAGALAGWFQQGCGILGSIVAIPVILHKLGQADAGLWFAFQGLITAISLTDFGFSTAIARQVAFSLRFRTDAATSLPPDLIATSSGWSGVSEVFSASRALFRRVTLTAAVATVVIYEAILPRTNLLGSATVESRLAWYLLGAAALVAFQSRLNQAILDGLGAMYVGRLVGGVHQILWNLGSVAVLLVWPTLVSVSIAVFGASLVQYAALESALSKMAGSQLNRRSGINKPLFAKLWRVALPFGIVNSGAFLAGAIQLPVLGSILGPAAVARYFLVFRISQSFNGVVAQFSSPQLPFFTQECAAGQLQAARARCKRILVITAAINTALALALYFLSPWVVEVWVGPDQYVDNVTLALFSINNAVIGVLAVAGGFVLASGRNPFALSTLIHGASSIIGVVLLCPKFGLAGVPLANLAGGLLTNYWRIPVEFLKTWRQITPSRT